MPDEVTQEQINIEARRQMGETGSAARPGRARAMAESMRKLQREQGAEAVMERARGDKGVTAGRRAEFLFQLDAARRPTAEANIDAANGLLQSGYDALPDAQKDVWRQFMKDGLDASRMGDIFQGVTTPRETQRLTEGFLRDQEFLKIYQQQLDKVINARPNLTKEVVNQRAQLLRADNPAAYPDMNAARTAARTLLLDEWRADQEDRITTLPRTAADALMVKNIERAQAASGEATNTAVKDAIAERERRWRQPGREGKENVRREFENFMQNGGQGVLDRDLWDRMSEDEREEFNKRYGEKIFTARVLAGKLNKDDMRNLATAEWLGEDFNTRVDKIRDMFEANNEFKAIIEKGQLDGTIDKNMWDKIKAAGPAGLAGAVLALIAALAFPPAAAIGYGLIAAGGAAAGGVAKAGVDELRAA